MMMPPSPQALSVFSCYAPQDAELREQFENHLMVLKQRGWIHSRSARDIRAGAERQQEIDAHLRTADLLLLFVSADFLSSQYGDDPQMQEILRRHRDGEAIVIPILLRSVDWKQTLFGELQALPRDGRPATRWSDQDEAFEQIAKEIHGVVEALRRRVVIISILSDQTFTAHLVQDLTAHDIPIFETEATQEPAILKKHIREASVAVVITSPGTEPTRTLKDVEDLSKRYQRQLIGLWVTDAARDEEMDASLPSQHHDWIVVGPGQEQHAMQELRATLQRRRFQVSAQTIYSPQEAPVILQEPRNPYKGLDAFTAADAGDFFGRTALVDALLTTVKTTLSQEKKGQQPARLLALVGASGSGKSSVVQAGLLPALQADRVFESNTWVYLDPIIPGAHPLQELARTLFEHFPEKRLEMIDGDMHYASLSGLHSYSRMIAKQRGSKHVVLVVDQFEEIFTLTEQEQERQQFLDLLVTACTKRDGPLIVILTLRGDFYDRLMQYPDPALYTLVAGHLIPMLPMTLPDLRAVITEPTRLPDVHLTFEGNLVGDLLFDVQGQTGALPLLQFTLEQLVEQREGHLLTEHAYQEMGGIRGALTQHAEACYQTLPSDAHRDLARTLFLRLLDPGTTEQETTRRRATLTEFAFADRGQTRLMQETIAAFVRARLLTITANEKTNTTTVKPRLHTTTANEKTNTTTVEVSHEALIRQWPRLSEWLRGTRDDIFLQQRISRDMVEWEQRSKPKDRLYQGSLLQEAQRWAKHNTPSEREMAFLRASVIWRAQSFLRLTLATILLLSIIPTGWLVWQHFQPNVTNLQDNGEGSLRQAIDAARAGDTITFSSSLRGTIHLESNLEFTRQIVIIGPGSDSVAISAGQHDYYIHVFEHASVSISDLSFKDSGIPKVNGSCAITPGFIWNEGNLRLLKSTISGNQNCGADHAGGGGITNSGTLTLMKSKVEHNTEFGSGGGIFNSLGQVTVINSTISANQAEDSGGGIYNEGGTVTVTNSSVSDNTAPAGGGIFGQVIFDIKSNTIVNNSVIARNTGGGIYVHGPYGNIGKNFIGSISSITNSTIADNTVLNQDISGGIEVDRAHTMIAFCTIYNNSSRKGSGISAETDEKGIDGKIITEVFLKNSIVAGNKGSMLDISGTIHSNGYNLIQHLSTTSIVSNTAPPSTDRDPSGEESLFGASLEYYGGFTQTYPLLEDPKNPAINAIPFAFCSDNTNTAVTTDQRGMPRPGKKKQNCDSGAYESQVSS